MAVIFILAGVFIGRLLLVHAQPLGAITPAGILQFGFLIGLDLDPETWRFQDDLMMLGATILASLLLGGLLSAFEHFLVLVPAVALILFAHAAQGLIEREFLSHALSIFADLTALELGFFLGVIFPLAEVSPDMAAPPSN